MEDSMKRFTTLVLVVFALAAVPAALADDGSAPTRPAVTVSTAPAAQRPAAQQPGQRPSVLPNLRHRVHAWVRHCAVSNATTPERCLARVKQILARLGKLDDRIQARIAKIQEACGTASTDAKCKNAAKRVDRLTKLDTRVQSVEQKLQDWLDGKGSAPTDPEGQLDSAAQQLGADG
jgi:hypothetical protein